MNVETSRICNKKVENMMKMYPFGKLERIDKDAEKRQTLENLYTKKSVRKLFGEQDKKCTTNLA